MRSLGTIVTLLVVVCIPVLSSADPAETVGISWAGRATGGACVANSHGPTAAWYNPAQVGNSGVAVFIGTAAVLTHQEPGTAHATSGTYAEAGLSLPVAVLGDYVGLWLGVTAISPPDSLYDIALHDDETLTFGLLDSRERRLSLSAALSLDLGNVLGIGVGFELLPTVDGLVAVDLANADGFNELHIDVGYRLSPTAGFYIEPLENLRIGLAYRGENATRLSLPVEVTAESLALSARVLAQTNYVPHRVSVGVEYEVALLGLSVEAVLGWQKYSDMPHPSPAVELYDESGVDTLGTEPPPAYFRDTFAPAIAVKYAGDFACAVGYRYQSAATTGQPDVGNLLDAPRHTVSLGGRVPLYTGTGIPAGLYVTADLFATWFDEQVLYKENLLPDNPGYPSVTVDGYRLGGGIGLELEY